MSVEAHSPINEWETDFLDEGTRPPFLDFRDEDVIQEFRGCEVKDPNYFFIQSTSLLKDLYDLEYQMTAWYNNWYFGNSMFKREKWGRIWVRGYYAAYSPNRKTWVRCRVDDIIYSNNFLEYKGGYYDVHIYLLDYAVSEVVPRRFLLPLRKEYSDLPIIGYIGSLQVFGYHYLKSGNYVAISSAFKDDIEDNTFKAIVVSQHELEDLPFQVLKLVIIQEGDLAKIYTLKDILTCGYMKCKIPSLTPSPPAPSIAEPTTEIRLTPELETKKTYPNPFFNLYPLSSFSGGDKD